MWWFKMRNEFKWVIVVAAKTYLKCGGKAAILEYLNAIHSWNRGGILCLTDGPCAIFNISVHKYLLLVYNS